MQELAGEVGEGDNGDSEAWAPDVKARDLRVESVVVQRVMFVMFAMIIDHAPFSPV